MELSYNRETMILSDIIDYQIQNTSPGMDFFLFSVVRQHVPIDIHKYYGILPLLLIIL